MNMSSTALVDARTDDVPSRHDWSTSTEPSIRLSDAFSVRQLLSFWDIWKHDQSRIGAYLDTTPTRLDDFLAPVASEEMYFWLIFFEGEVAGAGWLHDIYPYRGKRSAWFGLYHAPEYRSLMGAQTQHALWREAAHLGIPAIFAGTRHCNHRTKRFAERGGLHYVGTYPQFGWFEGNLDDLCLYTLNLDDRHEVWRQAEARAAYYRTHPPATALVNGLNENALSAQVCNAYNTSRLWIRVPEATLIHSRDVTDKALSHNPLAVWK
jgi:RimJ/RimL family protein N-acetyltransferase